MYFDENKFIINNGRKATGSGLIGLFIGIIISSIFSFSLSGKILFILFSGYLFLCGFWGAFRSNLWIRKYKYRMNTILWQIARVLIVILGFLAGQFLWGFFEHFILLLAISTGYENVPGMISAQIILLPFLGKYYSRLIKFNDGQ